MSEARSETKFRVGDGRPYKYIRSYKYMRPHKYAFSGSFVSSNLAAAEVTDCLGEGFLDKVNLA